jgi:hypothetical protein
MAFDADVVTPLVAEFCRYRRVDCHSSLRIVPTLTDAFDILARKGPDQRWRSLLGRSCPADVPRIARSDPAVAAERSAFQYTLNSYGHSNFDHLTRGGPAWFLRPVTVSAGHWSRFSQSIRTARQHGLGWPIPASRDILIVPAPTLRHTDTGLLHDDRGRRAVEWPDGAGGYFLDGLPFDASLYRDIIAGTLSPNQVAGLPNADHRSIALRYLGFQALVVKGRAELLDVGVRGTRLYRLRLPPRLAADRVRGYGRDDYFIHMRDASHPEREFIEWVDPGVAAHRNAELCQAHAFGIPLDVWLSVELEG